MLTTTVTKIMKLFKEKTFLKVYLVAILKLTYILIKPKMKVMFLEITTPHNCEARVTGTNKFPEGTSLGKLMLKSSGHHCIHKTWLQKMQSTVSC